MSLRSDLKMKLHNRHVFEFYLHELHVYRMRLPILKEPHPGLVNLAPCV